MRRIFVFLTIVAVLTLVYTGTIAAGGARESAQQRWRLGMVVGEPHPWMDAAHHFAQAVNEASGGRIEVTIYGAGQLGNENVMLSSLGDGSLDLFIGGLSTISAYTPRVGFVNMGRLFEDQDHFERALAFGGPVDEYYRAVIEDLGSNFRVLSLTGGGLRNTSSRMPIRHLSDLQGIRMRVPNVEVAAKFWEQLGTLPVSMSFPEIYTSLQTGVVDAFESSIPAYIGQNLYEVAPYHNKTEHEFMVSVFLMRHDLFNGLDPDLQQAVHRAGIEAGEVAMRSGVSMAEELLQEMEALGVTIVDTDKESFQVVAEPLQDEIAAEMGMTDLLEAIRASVAR